MATLDAAEAVSRPPIAAEFLECLGAKQQPPSKKRKVEDESLDECAGLLIDAGASAGASAGADAGADAGLYWDLSRGLKLVPGWIQYAHETDDKGQTLLISWKYTPVHPNGANPGPRKTYKPYKSKGKSACCECQKSYPKGSEVFKQEGKTFCISIWTWGKTTVLSNTSTRIVLRPTGTRRSRSR